MSFGVLRPQFHSLRKMLGSDATKLVADITFFLILLMLIQVSSSSSHSSLLTLTRLPTVHFIDKNVNQGTNEIVNSIFAKGNSSNDTVVVDLTPGGVVFTLVTNLIIGVVLFLLFVFVLRPCLALFNLKKKRQLMKTVKEDIKSKNNYLNYKDKGGDINVTVDDHILDDSYIINRDRQEEKFGVLLNMDNAGIEEEQDLEQNNSLAPPPIENSVVNNNIEPNIVDIVIDNNPVRNSISSTTPLIEPTKFEKFKQWIIFHSLRSWEFLVELYGFSYDVLLSFVSKKHNKEDMERLYNRYSRDVAVYLLFQKETILFMFIITVLCLIVLLPVHLTGTSSIRDIIFDYNGVTIKPSDDALLATTISMVLDSPSALMIHVILSYIVSGIIIFFLYRFMTHDVVTKEHFGDNQEEEDNNISTRLISNYSVMVYDLPKDFQSEPLFDKLVREKLCPNLKVTKTVLIYDVFDRIQMQNEYQEILDTLEHLEYVQKKKEEGDVCCSFKDYKKKIEELTLKKISLRSKFELWDKMYEKVKKDQTGADHEMISCLNYGFIIFETAEDASKCLDQYYKRGQVKLKLDEEEPKLSLSPNTNDTNSTNTTTNNNDKYITFTIKQAYEPEDINWDNMLTYSGWVDKVRNALLQIVVVLIVIFLTTPTALLSSLESISQLPFLQNALFSFKQNAGEFGSLLFQYTPTLLLHLFAILLPYGIWYAQDFSKFRSKSRYKRKLISRLFLYLAVSTLIMPMFSLTSFNTIIVNLVNAAGDIKGLLNNMFLPGAGVYLLNYVLQTALLKNFEDILSLYNIIYYFYGLRRAPNCSPLEKLKACELTLFYFEYEYPYMLTIVAICIANSLFTPIILCCGLLYLIFKHLVDRYVIMYIYGHLQTNACKDVVTSNFKSHKKLVHLISTLVIFILIIYHGCLALFFGIKISSMPWVIPHMVIQIITTLAVTIFWFFYYTKNSAAKAFLQQRFLKPLKNIYTTFKLNRQKQEIQESSPVITDTTSLQSTNNPSLLIPESVKAQIVVEPKSNYGTNSFSSTDISKRKEEEWKNRIRRAYEPPFKYFSNEKDM
ncbi:hypothetical protein ABK040_015593 [Willaertia magna]